jgi:hypothetical protein
LPHEISTSFHCVERHHSKQIFSVFRLKPHICFLHFIPSTTVYKCQLNKVCCAFNSFTSGFCCRWAVPGDRQKERWPWQPLMSFDGRVAESSRVPHSGYIRENATHLQQVRAELQPSPQPLGPRPLPSPTTSIASPISSTSIATSRSPQLLLP